MGWFCSLSHPLRPTFRLPRRVVSRTANSTPLGTVPISVPLAVRYHSFARLVSSGLTGVREGGAMGARMIETRRGGPGSASEEVEGEARLPEQPCTPNHCYYGILRGCISRADSVANKVRLRP